MDISELTKKTIKDQNINQTKFASIISDALAPHDSVTRAAVSTWIKGHNKPGYWPMLHIARTHPGTYWLGDWARAVLCELKPELWTKEE